MKHGSLFSGVGGFDLAAEWAGWENVFHCELNPICQRVLKYHFPNSISHDDIKKTDFTIYRGTIDILTGGFPCQPYSLAGKRKGKEDERHLWPEMYRAIKEIRPRWIVGENVFGIVNWSDGMVFDEVQIDLEIAFKNSKTAEFLNGCGYDVFTYVLPACAVNAPHRRDRIWFVAHLNDTNTNTNTNTNDIRRNRRIDENEINPSQTGVDAFGDIKSGISHGFIADTKGQYGEWVQPQQPQHRQSQKIEFGGINFENGGGWYNPNPNNKGLQRGTDETGIDKSGEGTKKQFTGLFLPGWDQFPTESPVCFRNDGVSTKLDGITFSKWRNEAIKAAGNAIVPQVAYQIFKTIKQYEKLYGTK